MQETKSNKPKRAKKCKKCQVRGENKALVECGRRHANHDANMTRAMAVLFSHLEATPPHPAWLHPARLCLASLRFALRFLQAARSCFQCSGPGLDAGLHGCCAFALIEMESRCAMRKLSPAPTLRDTGAPAAPADHTVRFRPTEFRFQG